ncbi:MAG: Spy/CpxP family protein refolding chaperone [Gluconobacter cerinus]|uniref:Spy/CpxP family protein refolding chaperone n=1 Tax=Gluconobacter cerinus TaxID=38307 RepID=UPI0039E72E26
MTAFRLSVLLPALASVGLLAGSALAHAHPGAPGPQPDGMHGRPGPGGMLPPFPPGITLTEAQKAQVHKIFSQGHEEMKARHEKLKALRDKIRTALSAEGDLDRTLLADLTKQESDLHVQEAQARLETQEKLHDILTPEQRRQANTTMEKIRSLHDQLDAIMGHPPEDGPPPAP